MERKNVRVKKPVNAFPKCPSCLMGHFLSVEGIHVFCGFCHWDSIQAYADAGGYDYRSNSDGNRLSSYGHSSERRFLIA